jgi:hypothetical protein
MRKAGGFAWRRPLVDFATMHRGHDADVKRALDELVDLGFVILTIRFYDHSFYAPNRESKLGLRVSTVSFLV